MASTGWASLGAALAGNGNTYEDAYQRGQTNAARVAGLIADARNKRDEAMARDQLQQAIVGSGASPGQAELLATALRGGFNPTQISGYQGDVQEQGFRGDSVARALAGDWGGANANLMGVANGPVDLATIQGQNLIANRLLPGGGGVTTTEQGRAGIAADAARAAASYASANSSNASAARTRQGMGLDLRAALEGTSGGRQAKAPSGYRWTSDGRLEAIPGGPADKGGASGGAGAGIGANWNDRQRSAVQGVQRNLVQYAAALTGKSPDEIRGMTAEEIAAMVQKDGGRLQQGALARVLEGIPFVGKTVGRLANEISNSDIVSYSQGAGSAWSGFENPTGPITNSDRESATQQMPNYLDPPEVQAAKIRNFLELSGWSGGQAPGGAVGQAVMGTAGTGAPVQVRSADEYNALPAGAQYVAPDGSVRRKK